MTALSHRQIVKYSALMLLEKPEPIGGKYLFQNLRKCFIFSPRLDGCLKNPGLLFTPEMGLENPAYLFL